MPQVLRLGEFAVNSKSKIKKKSVYNNISTQASTVTVHVKCNESTTSTVLHTSARHLFAC